MFHTQDLFFPPLFYLLASVAVADDPLDPQPSFYNGNFISVLLH